VGNGFAILWFKFFLHFNEEDNLGVVRGLIGMTSWTSRNFNNRKSKNLQVSHSRQATPLKLNFFDSHVDKLFKDQKIRQIPVRKQGMVF
jgi:hypothetical protein